MDKFSNLKLIFIGTRGVPANYGGFETYVDRISAQLADLGCKVTVVNPSDRPVESNLVGQVRIKYAINLERFFKNRHLRAFTTIIYDIHALLKASIGDYNIVVVCGYASGPFLIIPRLFGRYVIINPDGFEWKSSRWGRLTIYWLRMCEYVAAKWTSGMIADSQEIGSYFRRKFKANPVVIEYGANTLQELARPAIISSIGDYYLACARMVPETNIHMVISGFLQSGTNAKLIIVGPITDEKYFTTQVEPLIDNLKVIYLGAIYTPGVLPAIRANANALLHGHASDGTNPSLIESMGASSPVLAIDRPSNRYPLTDKYDCFFIDEHDLADKIQRFELLSKESKLQIGLYNKQNITDRFSWEVAALKHVNFFQGLANEI